MMRARRALVVALLAVSALVVALALRAYFSTGHEVVLLNADQVPIAGGSVQFGGEPAVALHKIGPGEARSVQILARGKVVYDGGYDIVVRWETGEGKQETLSFLARGAVDKIDVKRGTMVRRGTPPDSGYRYR